MAKRFDEPIEVTTDGGAWAEGTTAPVAFSWRGRRYYVDERLSTWREAGEWWQNETAPNGHYDREFFRVAAHPAGMGTTGELDADGFIVTCSSVYDIYRDRINDIWKLARLWD